MSKCIQQKCTVCVLRTVLRENIWIRPGSCFQGRRGGTAIDNSYLESVVHLVVGKLRSSGEGRWELSCFPNLSVTLSAFRLTGEVAGGWSPGWDGREMRVEEAVCTPLAMRWGARPWRVPSDRNSFHGHLCPHTDVCPLWSFCPLILIANLSINWAWKAFPATTPCAFTMDLSIGTLYWWPSKTECLWTCHYVNTGYVFSWLEYSFHFLKPDTQGHLPVWLGKRNSESDLFQLLSHSLFLLQLRPFPRVRLECLGKAGTSVGPASPSCRSFAGFFLCSPLTSQSPLEKYPSGRNRSYILCWASCYTARTSIHPYTDIPKA